jgi:hypothetical protein
LTTLSVPIMEDRWFDGVKASATNGVTEAFPPSNHPK